MLEAYAGKSIYANHGQRVVNGYRLMQSASDIFLGWTEGKLGRHFYMRQLKDMKLAPLVELFTSGIMTQYAEICGWALARAHARSGEPAAISGYLGKSDAFDKAIAEFCVAYADQNERDHEALRKAAQSGRVEVVMEPDSRPVALRHAAQRPVESPRFSRPIGRSAHACPTPRQQAASQTRSSPPKQLDSASSRRNPSRSAACLAHRAAYP